MRNYVTSQVNEEAITNKTEYAENYWRNQTSEDLSWMQKSCVYHRCIWDHLDVPTNGKVVQLGVGHGQALELLYSKFGDRTIGIDLFNMCDHPVLKVEDVRTLEDMPVAYVYCNIGSFTNTPQIRKIALEWSLRNLVKNGICLTSGNHSYVEEKLGYKIADIAKNYNCHVLDMPNDALIKQMNTLGKYSSDHDCIIIKND